MPGSVRNRFGKLFAAMYSDTNSITFSVVGFGENKASGHPEWLSTSTGKYFFFWFAFWNGPAKSRAISSFGLLESKIFQNFIL